MPTYVYECAKCGDEFELWQSFTDDPLKKHNGCGGKVTKVLQPVGIVLKGSGFYKTDNRGGAPKSSRPESSPAESSGSSAGKSSDKSSDNSSSSTKSDSKSGTKRSDSAKSGTKAAKAG